MDSSVAVCVVEIVYLGFLEGEGESEFDTRVRV